MSIRAFAALAVALALAAAAGAQSRPRPDDPAVKTPPRAQTSAYEGYRPFREEDVAPWREVNDEVGRLGGHSGHVGKDAAVSPAVPPQTSAPARPAPSAHPGGPKHAH